MIQLNGKYGKAIVYNSEIEEIAMSQIINLLNQPMTEGANVRIMPDVHAGSGCVIGYTAKLTDKIVPNLIGVDIGCGVCAWSLGHYTKAKLDFQKLDNIIREYVPSGRNIRNNQEYFTPSFTKIAIKEDHLDFMAQIFEINNRTKQDDTYVLNSLGTLGGGNHFIEIDKDEKGYLWLIIHSGSRNFGLKVAQYHQKIAETSTLTMSKEEYNKKLSEIKRTKKGKSIEISIKKLKAQAFVRKHKRDGLEYLEGREAENYILDMNIAQLYAQLNRRIMGKIILENMRSIIYFNPIESVHNYINMDDKIIRKGAISAHKEESVIIPLNMADGSIMGFGKGNEEWNNSAPHGAGRLMSRRKAKETIQLKDFEKIMEKNNVWSSTVGQSTLDEAPQAYKDTSSIIKYLEPTISSIEQIKPIYNYKANE